METGTFRPSRTQQIYFWVFIIVGLLILIALPLAIASIRPALIILAGIAAIIIGPLFILVGLHYLVARTELAQSGIRTSHLIRRRTCRWEDISSLTTSTTADGRGFTMVTTAIIELRNGKKVTLAMPRQWSPFPNDRQFDEKVAAIRADISNHSPDDRELSSL